MDLIQFGIVLKAVDQMSGVFGSAASKSMGALGRLDARVGQLSERLERLGTKAMGEGALLTGMMQKPVEAFMAAEDAAARLNATMLKAGGEVDPQFERMISLGKKLGASLPGSDAEYIKMLQTLQEEGIKTSAILGGLGEASAKFKVIMGDKVTADGAAKLTAQLSDALRAKEGEMGAVMDYAARLQGVGANADYSLGFFSNASPSLSLTKKTGIDAMTELAPIAAMAANSSMDAGSAGGAFNKLLAATLDSKKVAKTNKLMAESGQQFDFVGKDGNFLGVGNFIDQIQKLNKLNHTQFTEVVKELFGGDQENTRLLNTLREKGVDGYNEYAKRMADQAKLADRIKVLQETLGNKWDAAMGGFSSNLVTIGESMSPALKGLVDIFEWGNTALAGLMKEYPRLTQVLSVGVAGIGGGLLALGGAAMVAATAVKGLGLVFGPLGKLRGLFGKKGAAGAAGAAAEAAADKLGVQRVWVTNWPGGGFDLGDKPGGAPDGKPGGKPKPGGGRLSRLGNAIKSAPGALITGGRAALAAPTLAAVAGGGAASVLAAGGMVAGAGAAGYGAGTLINAGITKALTAANGGREQSLGSWLYDKINGDRDAKLLAPTPVVARTVPSVAAPVPAAKLAASAAAPSVAAPAPVVKLAAPAPAPSPSVAAPAPVVKLAAPVPSPSVAAPAPVVKLAAPTPVAASRPPVPKPAVPLNPAAASKSNVQAQPGKTVVPQVTLHYSPTLTIQGDPIPGTAAKFKAMLMAHRDELLKLVNQAVENKARAAY